MTNIRKPPPPLCGGQQTTNERQSCPGMSWRWLVGRRSRDKAGHKETWPNASADRRIRVILIGDVFPIISTLSRAIFQSSTFSILFFKINTWNLTNLFFVLLENVTRRDRTPPYIDTYTHKLHFPGRRSGELFHVEVAHRQGAEKSAAKRSRGPQEGRQEEERGRSGAAVLTTKDVDAYKQTRNHRSRG